LAGQLWTSLAFQGNTAFSGYGEELPSMSVTERVVLAKMHLAKSIEVKGERVGVLEMRRHLSCYFKSLTDFKPVRLKLVTEDNPEEIFRLLDFIDKKWAKLTVHVAFTLCLGAGAAS
jgi:tRNA-dihydrouridine synthase